MVIGEQKFSTLVAAANALADDLASTAREAIASRGQCLLAVSGGTTPVHVFARLHQSKVDWERVTLTLTDERWVPKTHPESNEKLVRTHLLKGDALSTNFIPLFGGEDSPQTGQAACEERIKNLPLPFDAVYLGMGADGHFASLFPGDPAIEISDCCCVAIPATEKRLARMSLTASILLNSQKIFLLFNGSDKYATFLETKKNGPLKELPLRLLFSQTQTPVHVLWAP